MRSLQNNQLKKLSNFKKYDMKIIRNNIIPFSGFKAMNLFGVLFVRKGASINDKTVNHEQIHSKQIEEVMFTLFLPFFIVAWHTTFYLLIAWIFSYYIWYVAEWLIHLIRFKDRNIAYRRISFEMEAYTHDGDMEYLKKRKKFAFIK